MGCKVPFERFVFSGWRDNTTSPSALTVPNTNGCAMISLGSSDQVGAVLVTPSQSNQSSLIPYIVSAGAPLIGEILGPFTVTPVFLPGSTTTPTVLPTLDLLVWETLPPFSLPSRAPLFYARTFTQAEGAASFRLNVRGRKRTIIGITPGAGSGTDDLTVGGIVYGVSVAGTTSYSAVVQNGTYSAAGAAVIGHEFFPTISVQGGVYPGATVLDTITVGRSTVVSARDFTAVVQAWD
jgi:hypothetical protein